MSTNEIKTLEQKLQESNTTYYAFGTSDLSDAEYDSLKDRLAKLDPKNKLLKQIDADAKEVEKLDKTPKAKKWEKYVHETFKLGSLDKVNSFDQFSKWVTNLNETEYLVQEKLDGISIKLMYSKGKLLRAITRGNDSSGVSTGEDITRNVIKMKGVPETIPFANDLVVRGEILLFKSKFDLVGGKNCRNSAGGAAKGFDGKGCCYLNVKCYSVMNWKEIYLSKEEECLSLLEALGFDVVAYKKYNSIDNIQKYYQSYIDSIRKTLDWDIDGLVVKTNEIKQDKWDIPDRGIAYKFPHETGVTKLLDVIWQDTGGRISPVAILEPLELNGVTISRVSLNNIEFIQKLKLKIGDFVTISRRNEVIPYIENVAISSKDGKEVIAPTVDSEGYAIIHETNSEGKELVYLISTNPNSIHKKVRSIYKWYEAHDTKGIARETIASIVSEGIATSLPEFYDIGLKGHIKLSTLEGFGLGKFKVLNQATLLTSKTSIVNFMDGIDIQGFGKSRFETILEAYNKDITIKDFIDLCKSDDYISTINGFAANTAKTLANAINDKTSLIDALLQRVIVEDWSPQKPTSSKINGLSFCFTGKMQYDRDILEKAVKKHGGLVAGVSKNLSYLVVNDLNSASSKNQKAIKINISRISEQQFINMISGDI